MNEFNKITLENCDIEIRNFQTFIKNIQEVSQERCTPFKENMDKYLEAIEALPDDASKEDCLMAFTNIVITYIGAFDEDPFNNEDLAKIKEKCINGIRKLKKNSTKEDFKEKIKILQKKSRTLMVEEELVTFCKNCLFYTDFFKEI